METTWTPVAWFSASTMWILHMIAMMVPTFIPAVLAFSTSRRRSHSSRSPYRSTTFFVLGYVVLWILLSLVYVLLHRGFVSVGWMGGIMGAIEPTPGAFLLLLAGAVQWMSVKIRCLERCRDADCHADTRVVHPSIAFFTEGIRHGLYCAGSTWALMTLMFVFGVMNLWAMALLTVYILVEKAAPRGILISRLGGVLLIAWGFLHILPLPG